MADFCKQCSLDMWGDDLGDLAFIADKEGLYATICEGCGVCIVNRLGECQDCELMKGKPGHGPKEK